MYALDAETGKIVWEFYLVPKTAGDPTRGPRGAFAARHLDLGQNAAGHADHRRRDLDILHPGPGNGLALRAGRQSRARFAPGLREGENLYSGSVVVLDAKTGAYKTHFKIVPKDWHDWDVSGARRIIRTAGGKKLLSSRRRTAISTASTSPPAPCSIACR